MVIEVVLSILGLVVTVMMPFLAWTVTSLYTAKQDNATQQNQIDLLTKESEKGKNARREMHLVVNDINTDLKVLNTEVKNIDSGIALSIENLNATLDDLRNDLNHHKSDTNTFIKEAVLGSQTIIMDKLELMMLRQTKG